MPAFFASLQDSLDTVVSGADVPTAPPTPLESVMLAEDKLYVVLLVVLIIWFGILFLLFRTDRHLAALERDLDARIPSDTPDSPVS